MKKGFTKIGLLALLGLLVACGTTTSETPSTTSEEGTTTSVEQVTTEENVTTEEQVTTEDNVTTEEQTTTSSEGTTTEVPPATSEDPSSETPATSEDPVKPYLTVTEALEKADDETVVVRGVVSNIGYAWNSTDKNMTVTISDGTSSLECYKLGTQVDLGAEIEVSGKMDTYSSKRQIAQGATAVVITAPTPVEMNLSDARLAENKYKTVTLKGTVISVDEAWSTSYNNMCVTIADADASLYLYRLKTQVEVGDVITTTGVLDVYGGQPQLVRATATINEGETVALTGVSAVDSLSIEAGKTADLEAKVQPLNTTERTISFSSDNASVATVDGKGKVTGVAAGTANITVSAGTFTKVVPVTVTASVAYNELAKFNLGADDASKTNEANQDGSSTATYTESVGTYTLSITNGVKFYKGSYDAKGNACFKLGTGSAAGSFTFVAPEGVDKVVIAVAGYKSNKAAIKINNGSEVIVESKSANGEYTELEIDVSTNKTVNFTTTSNGYRCKINSISFLALA